VNKKKQPVTRPSLNNWENAHTFAIQAREALTRPKEAHSRNDAESKGQQGLDLLGLSVSQLEKIGSLTDCEEATLSEEMQKLIERYFP